MFIGSFNFDPRSAHLNTELGFVIDSPELAQRMAARLDADTPLIAYELRLSDKGKLHWIERHDDGREIVHDTEPGTTRWRRAMVAFIAILPIEWLL